MRPLERLVYRTTGVNETHEMRWTEYAMALLLFSVVSMLVLYCMQRLQGLLPFNPQGFGGVAPDLAFNTAVSFTTNTNWQAYSGESTMSYFTQMAGLAYHNFVSAAVGIAVAIAFIRGIAQQETDTIGNFWVDMVRASLWVLLPIAVVGSLFFVSQGVVQNLKPYDTVQTVEGATQMIAQGPVASQEVIKQFGTNGGGFFNANSAHPYENPTPLSNWLAMFGIFFISSGLTYTLGTMTGSRRHGWAVWAAMAFLFLAGVTVAYWAEARGNPLLTAAGADQTVDRDVTGRQHGRQGSPLRYRRTRRSSPRSTTDASCGAVNGWHDSFTPLGGLVTLANIQLERGRVRRRRRRHVRRAGLHHPVGVHRRPDGRPHARVPGQEDSGVRSADGDAHGADLLARHPHVHRRSRRCSGFGTSSIFNPGPHGLVEMLYAYSSGGGQQRLGVRRLEREHALVQHDARPRRCCSGGSS